MQRSGVPDWGSIGRMSALTSLVAAVVTFFVLPDQRWIATIFVGIALFDALIFGLLLPRLSGGGTGRAPTLSDLEQMNAEAEWGVESNDPYSPRKPDDV